MEKINKNYYAAEYIFRALNALGIGSVVISPGSRSTPLTVTAAKNSNFTKTVIVDERSAAFFALGESKKTGKPSVLICTSGTALVEYYPAVVEAFQSRIPLIILSADRPTRLRGTGANQTINQKHIFKNHIRFSEDMMTVDSSFFCNKSLILTIKEAVEVATSSNPGPVHVNIPFEKPLEPNELTDDIFEVQTDHLNEAISALSKSEKPATICVPDALYKKFIHRLKKSSKPLIVIGGGNYSDAAVHSMCKFAEFIGAPIIVDIQANQSFREQKTLKYSDAYLRHEKIREKFSPDFVVLVGRPPISKWVFKFIESAKEKILINPFADNYMIAPTAKISNISDLDFTSLYEYAQTKNVKRKENPLFGLYELETLVENRIQQYDKLPMSVEPAVYVALLKGLPDSVSLMLSNSWIPRDADNYLKSSTKSLAIYTNRGASGIDGIISTALGISSHSTTPAYCLIGDLAFFYDINSLITAKNLDSSLTIIVLNNNGGGIFSMLPIAKQFEEFEQYFATPLNLNIKELCKGAGVSYTLAKTQNELIKLVSHPQKNVNVIEIKTSTIESMKIREELWELTATE